MPGPWLLVGLGNPDSEYAGTRHNAGAMALELLAGRVGGRLKPLKGRRADVCEGRLDGEQVVLGRPSTYMNLSGGPVRSLADFFKVGPERLVVLHDELDVDFGVVRLKRGGGAGGHNGLRDIDKAMGSREYLRVRIGIGRPPGRMDPADFVLKPFAGPERTELPLLLDRAADAAQELLTTPLETVQNRVHGLA